MYINLHNEYFNMYRKKGKSFNLCFQPEMSLPPREKQDY